MLVENGDDAESTAVVIPVPNRNYLQAAILLKTLADRGAKYVIISPGSRSTPLARTAVLMPQFHCTTILDERSAGFYALGISKSSGTPAILICTSGTAGANYYPAVIEAAQSFAPVIVLTADRPLGLRNSGAPQTIDQEHLFGKYAKNFADVPEAAADENRCRSVRDIAVRAFLKATGTPGGPVHLNVPFDEPLAPVEMDADACEDIWKRLSGELTESVVDSPSSANVDSVADAIQKSMCGLIVAGPHTEDANAVFDLGRSLGWPIFADVVSGIRYEGDPVIPYYDIFLRAETPLKPDLVLEFGGCPTSKVLNEYLNRSKAETIRIQSHGNIQDPFHRAERTITGNVKAVCAEITKQIRAARDSLLLEPFSRYAATLRVAAASLSSTEAGFVNAVLRAMPDETNLVLASSLPIRYADSFAVFEGKRHRVFAQRGTNGIDGTISHAAGVAAGSKLPTLLICGDLAFLHDIGGLLAAREVRDHLTILVLNNDGGGIFSFLPVAEYADTFEKIHGTPHGRDIASLADFADADWKIISDPNKLSDALELNQVHKRLRIVEVKSNRAENRREHEKLMLEFLKGLN